MEAKATAKFIRCTPRKINQILSLIRGQSVLSAYEVLSFVPNPISFLVKKVLKSAVANANSNKDFSEFSIKETWVATGSTLKRMKYGPKGRGMPFKKRTSHLTIVITNERLIQSKIKKQVLQH
jgi:large subunit ribosomal protein L22